MEKYRQFGDKGTGVHPFTPIWASHRTPLVLRILKVLVVPVALVRLLIFGIAMLWLGLAEVICMLIPIAVVRQPVNRILTWIGCFVALLALGIVSMNDELADNRRLKLAVSKTAQNVFNARRGTMIFVNHQSLVDVLLLGLKVSPVFVFPATDGTPVQFSLLAALRRASSHEKEEAPAKSSGTLDDIAARAKSNWQSVVVFPEGSRTIGNAVLAWKAKTFDDVQTISADSAIMSIQYSKGGAFTPHHTVGTGLWFLFWLCMQLPHTAKTMWLSSSDVAVALKGQDEVIEQVVLLRAILVRMIKGAVEVEVDCNTHLRFVEFWKGAQQKNYTQKMNKKA